MELWVGAVVLGLLYALMTTGVYLTYRVYNFADITVDGSFTAGGAAAAALIVAGTVLPARTAVPTRTIHLPQERCPVVAADDDGMARGVVVHRPAQAPRAGRGPQDPTHRSRPQLGQVDERDDRAVGPRQVLVTEEAREPGGERR